MASKLLSSGVARAVVPHLIAAYVKLVEATTRWQVIGAEHRHAAIVDGDQPTILAVWHSRLLMGKELHGKGTKREVACLVSQNHETDLLAKAIELTGGRTVRGSRANPKKKDKDKGGTAALRALLADAKAGRDLSLTPDGPKGPAGIVSPGVIQLARLGKLPIMPMGYSTRWGITLKSWDRFHLPLPFGRGVKVYGAPIIVGKDTSAAQRALEKELTALTNIADEACGRTPTTSAAVQQARGTAETLSADGKEIPSS